MFLNIEELKSKITYRSSYRGSKEMDILMTTFVKFIINDLDLEDLIKLNELVNLDDENLYKIRNDIPFQIDILDNNIIQKFKKFKF